MAGRDRSWYQINHTIHRLGIYVFTVTAMQILFCGDICGNKQHLTEKSCIRLTTNNGLQTDNSKT